MNRPSARTTSALPRHNGRRRSLRFIHAHIHARARVHSYSFFSRGSSLSLSPSRASSLYLPVLFPLSRSPSLPPSASSRGFRSFRESMRHTIDRGTPRKIPPRPAPRVSPSPPGVLTDIFSLAARCAARQRPAPRVPRRPFARSIFTRFSDAGNYITPESDSLDARARERCRRPQAVRRGACGAFFLSRANTSCRNELAHFSTCILGLGFLPLSLSHPLFFFFNNV